MQTPQKSTKAGDADDVEADDVGHAHPLRKRLVQFPRNAKTHVSTETISRDLL